MPDQDNSATGAEGVESGAIVPRSGVLQRGIKRKLSETDENVLLFAVPKKGRLLTEVMKLLEGAGLDARRPERTDVAMCKQLPVKLVFLPAHDIPSYVMDGNVHLGISGSDVLQEFLAGEDVGAKQNNGQSASTEILRKLGIGQCKLCVQAPVALEAKTSADLAGTRIVTSFPNLTRRHFQGFDKTQDTKTKIKVVSGSVEAACGLGLADAVVDLVETGTTMRAAGLEVVETILETEALLFSRPLGELSERKAGLIKLIQQRINGYLTATKYVLVVYNVHKDHFELCTSITPGKRSPTVTNLNDPEWRSVQVLVEKHRSNSVMDSLVQAGATDILSIPVQNTRM